MRVCVLVSVWCACLLSLFAVPRRGPSTAPAPPTLPSSCLLSCLANNATLAYYVPFMRYARADCSRSCAGIYTPSPPPFLTLSLSPSYAFVSRFAHNDRFIASCHAQAWSLACYVYYSLSPAACPPFPGTLLPLCVYKLSIDMKII